MSIAQEHARVLLVDDDHAFLDRAVDALDPVADLRTARSGQQALSIAVVWRPDVILLDMLLDDLDGFTFLDHLTTMEFNQLPFILCTTDGHGANTRVRPLPNWRVGTLVRSSSSDQLQSAVIEAVACQGSDYRRRATI